MATTGFKTTWRVSAEQHQQFLDILDEKRTAGDRAKELAKAHSKAYRDKNLAVLKARREEKAKKA